MKRFFRLSVVALAAMALFSGCQKYDDAQIRQDIKALGERVATLEAWTQSAQEAVGYVAVLKEAVENMNSIVSVDVFEDESGSGYAITFTDGQAIRLYNGQDGDTFFGNVSVGSSCVEFILADGTRFFVDRLTSTISFDSFETKTVARGDTIWTVMNEAFTKSEFAAFTAELKTDDGTAVSIATKSAADDSQWKIAVIAPEFNEEGSLAKPAGIVIKNTPQTGGKGVLKVSLVTNNGKETSSSLVVDIVPNYLTFEAVEAGATVSMEIIGEVEAPSLEYSTDLNEWTKFDFSNPQTITLENVGDKVYWRNTGTTNEFSHADEENFLHFDLGSKKIAAKGNIMSLLDINCEMNEMPDDAHFTYLFESDTLLVSAPELPATKLSPACYYGMFSGCISLEEAPVLPAIELSQDCYYGMFAVCESLEKAPALPALELVQNCYNKMFLSCSSLKEAPVLPATKLAEYCYSHMFYICTSLEKTPKLPANKLAEGCYSGMFCGCESLEDAPALPATELADYCYYGMFTDCVSLTKIPSSLPATVLADYCYTYMFSGCESLEEAPELPAQVLAEGCYESMFEYCPNLNYLKVGFDDWREDIGATAGWVVGVVVGSEGTFQCPDGLEVKYGVDYVPAGWSVNGVTPAAANSYMVSCHNEQDL